MLLFALALQPSTQEAFILSPPYARGEIYVTKFDSSLSLFGSEMNFGDKYEFICTKRSGAKISGRLLSRENSFDGEEWGDGNEYLVEMNSRGMVTKFDGGEGDGERAVAMLRFFVYPDRKVTVGDKWTWSDSKVGYEMRNELVGFENGRQGRVARVITVLTPVAGAQRRAVGLFWIREDGIVERIDWTLENFTHPWFDSTPIKKWQIQGEFVKRLTKVPGSDIRTKPKPSLRG